LHEIDPFSFGTACLEVEDSTERDAGERGASRRAPGRVFRVPRAFF
jgi:hypothetical protein